MKFFLALSCLVLMLGVANAGTTLCTDCPSCVPDVNPDFPLPGDTSCNAKVVFIMDESGSIRDFKQQAVGAATAFWTSLAELNNQGGSASLGLIEFSTHARVVQPVLRNLDDAYLAELNAYINSNASGASGYDPQGTTNWGAALKLVADTFNTPENKPDVVVFFTDGEPNGHEPFICDAGCYPFETRNGDVGHSCYEADRIKSMGVKLFTVGVGAVFDNIPPIQIISGGSVETANFGEGATEWDLRASTFGTADYVVDPDLNNLASVLREVANALCPVCAECAVFPTRHNPVTFECTGPEPPTFDPIEFTTTGTCGPPRLGVINEGWTGGCRRGTVKHTLAVLDTCDGETDIQFEYVTEVTDTTPPTLVCPPAQDLGRCEDALSAIQALTTTADDVCSGAFVRKGDIRTLVSDDDQARVIGYEVDFSAEDGCEISSTEPCTVRYTCGDGADLEVKKFSNIEDCAVAGDDERDIRYTIQVTNHGPTISKEVVLTDIFPTGGVLEQRGAITTSVGEVTSTAEGLSWTIGDMQVDDVATISFRLFLDASFEVGLITNRARAISDITPDPNLCNNEDKDVVRVCRESDLSVTKTDNKLQVTAGEKVGDELVIHVYEVEVTNAGISDANNVEVVDEWPKGFTLVQYQVGDNGMCEDTIGGFKCVWPTVPAGQSRIFLATYTVPHDTEAGPQINSVHVSSDSTDPNGENNHNNDITYVRTEADLGVTKTDGVTEVTAGDGASYQYTITVTNHGPSTGREISIHDVWPQGFHRSSETLTPSSGSCVTATGAVGSFSCNFGTLQPDETATVTVDYTVPSSTQECDVSNVVEVSGMTFDPNICNNVNRDTNAVLEKAELVVVKSAHRMDDSLLEEIEVGSDEEFYYRFYVSNNGPSTARQTTLTDTWPVKLTQYRETLTCSQGGCATTGADFTCALGSIRAHTAVICTVKFTLSEQMRGAGELRNDVSVFSPTDSQCRSDSHSLTVFVNSGGKREARNVAAKTGKAAGESGGLAPEHIIVKTKLVDGVLQVVMNNPHTHEVTLNRFVVNTMDAKNNRGHVVLTNDENNTCAQLKGTVLESHGKASCTVQVDDASADLWKRGSFTVQGLSHCEKGLRPLLTTEAIL